MKFIVFSLFVAVVCVAAQDACDNSAMTHFTSILGQEAVAATNKMFKSQLQTCFNIETPRKIGDITSNCAMSTSKYSVKEFGIRQDITLPDLAGFLNWYKTMTECRLDAMGVTYSGSDIDSNTFLDAILAEKWSKDADLQVMFEGIVQKCVNAKMTGGQPAYKQLYSTERCVIEEMLQFCKIDGKDSGLTLVILKGFYSLMEPAKCDGFKVPANLTTDIVAECLLEANNEWESKSGNTKYDGSMLNHDIKEKIQTAFDFFKNYVQKILIKTTTCAVTKSGMISKENGIEFDNTIDRVKSFDWQDMVARDQVIAAINECRIAKQSDGKSVDIMGEFLHKDLRDKHASPLLQKLKFDTCFVPKFVDACGLNNDVSTFFYPMMNNDISHMLIKDFRKKKGFTALLHVQSIFSDQFMYFVEQLV